MVATTSARSAELLATAGRSTADIAAVGVTGMLPAVILLDRRTAAAPAQHPAERWPRDSRGGGASRRDGSMPQRSCRRRARRYNQQLVAPKLTLAASATSRTCSRSIATVLRLLRLHHLAADRRPQVEHNWALESGFVDLASGRMTIGWSALGRIDPAKLPPPIRSSHEVVGEHHARGRLGTPASRPARRWWPAAPIMSPRPSSRGVARNGDLVIKFGGAGDILLASDAPSRRSAACSSTITSFPGSILPNGCMAASGALLNWIVRELGRQGRRCARARRRIAQCSTALRECRPAPKGCCSCPISSARRRRCTTRMRAAP